MRFSNHKILIAGAALLLCACNSENTGSQASNDGSVGAREMPSPAVIFPALNVIDLEATEAFYTDMLGMKSVLRLGGEGDTTQEVTLNFSGDLYAPESSLVLNYNSERTEPYTFDAFSRIAFRVDDVDMLVEKMRAAGYKVLSEPRMIEGTGIKLAFVEDPNGARVELIQGMASADELEGSP